MWGAVAYILIGIAVLVIAAALYLWWLDGWLRRLDMSDVERYLRNDMSVPPE